MNELEFSNEEKKQKKINKRQAYYLLYEKIEKYYKDLCSLSNQNIKDSIIDEIIKQCNEKDQKEIEIYLKQQYFKINKSLFDEYKNHIIIEEESKKININWQYLFETIIKILLFPIIFILGYSLTYKPHKNK